MIFPNTNMRSQTGRSLAGTLGLLLIFSLVWSATSVWAELVPVYSEDFENGPGGWVPVDRSGQDGVFWNHIGCSVDCAGEEMGAMRCGTDFPYMGYGNNWEQFLSKPFALPEGEVTLTYTLSHDLEVGFDYLYVEVSVDGGQSFTVLDEFTGRSTSFTTHQSDLSPYAGMDVLLRFRVVTDVSYSDEDGYYDSDGACHLDEVSVTGYPADTFDADACGWVATVPSPVGAGPYRLETVGTEHGSTTAWVAYDLEGPNAGQFPFGPLDRGNDIGIVSPPIPIPANARSYSLRFKVYNELPLLEYVYFYFEIAAIGPQGTGIFRNSQFIYYGNFEDREYDVTSFIPSGTTQVKVRLVAMDYWYYWRIIFPWWNRPESHGPGPFFDDVTFLADSEQIAYGEARGQVAADCPQTGTPLHGVRVNLFESGSGDLAASAVTDETGAYVIPNVLTGDYTLSVVGPLGYAGTFEETSVNITAGQAATADFQFSCLDIQANPRGVGYWKHQVSRASGGKGPGQGGKMRTGDKGGGDCSSSPLVDYLDLIAAHFNSNAINQVVVYQPPSFGGCDRKIEVASRLLNLTGNQEMIARARQQLMALLLNVAAGNIHLTAVISEDGATVSQAITHCDQLIDDPFCDKEPAKTIADLINSGRTVPAGMIPLDTAQIAYRQPPELGYFQLGNHPNPFNPATTIVFTLERSADYRLSVFDSSGRLVRGFAARGRAGLNEVTWNGLGDDGLRQGSGVYFYALESEGRRETSKMVLLK